MFIWLLVKMAMWRIFNIIITHRGGAILKEHFSILKPFYILWENALDLLWWFMLLLHVYSIRTVLLKQIPQSSQLNMLWSAYWCSLGAPKQESFRVKLNQHSAVCQLSSISAVWSLLLDIHSLGKMTQSKIPVSRTVWALVPLLSLFHPVGWDSRSSYSVHHTTCECKYSFCNIRSVGLNLSWC